MAHTTHHTHFTYTSPLEADYISEAEQRFHPHRPIHKNNHETDSDTTNTCPGALAARIDAWLWLNVLVSLCALATILASESAELGWGLGNHWLKFLLALAASMFTSTGNTRDPSSAMAQTQNRVKTRIQAFQSQQAVAQAGDRTTALTITGLVLAGVFYTSILLVLSRRERRIAEQAQKETSPTRFATSESSLASGPPPEKPMTFTTDSTETELDPLDTLESAADTTSLTTSRENVVFLMLIVCQNALAALLLYVGIRVMFLIKSTSTMDEQWWGRGGEVYVYLELGYTVVQAALMLGVIVQCTVQDDKLGEYMRTRQGLASFKEKLGWVDREGETLEEYAPVI